MAAKILLIFAAFVCSTTTAARRSKTRLPPAAGSGERRPNIIFILTDDLDKELGSPAVMKKTQRLIRQRGAEFTNAFVNSPMCCPSRSSILTGMYTHNHHTHTNNVNCSSPQWRRGPERRNFGRFLQNAGYATGYFGKYLNEYDGSYVPHGWQEWAGLVRNTRFYNYTLRRNTYKKRYGNRPNRDYFTDVVTDESIKFLRQSKKRDPNVPVLMVISHGAPHGPETPAPRHTKAFPNASAPRLPNWDYPSPDKHWIVRRTPPMNAQRIAFTDLLHRRRLLTLLSVDDAIERVSRAVKNLGLENETYIFFTSDHGYHLGQFGIIKGKSMPYEADIRVPLYVRGPNIPKNISKHEIVLNIDLAPTFLDIGGVKQPKSMDGVSIMKLFQRATNEANPRRHKWRDTYLVERGRGWKRTQAFMKAMENANSSFSSPLEKPRPPPPSDSNPRSLPHPTSNPSTTSPFSSSTHNSSPSSSSSSSSSSTSPGAGELAVGTKAAILNGLCGKPDYQSPCKSGQAWECVVLQGRQRLRKCKRNGTARTSASELSKVSTATLPPPPGGCMCLRPVIESGRLNDEWSDGDLVKVASHLRRRRSLLRKYRARTGDESFKRARYFKEFARALRQQRRMEKARWKQSENPKTRMGELEVEIAVIRELLRYKRKELKQYIKTVFEEVPCLCTEPTSKLSQTSGEETGGGVGTAGASKRTKGPTVRKSKKKAKKENCGGGGLNCFHHTEQHWKVPPLWKRGEFCFCSNAANNSYFCLRTINATHNFLYCEFITGFIEYFDVNADPYQLRNVAHTLHSSIRQELHELLVRLKVCKGSRECTHFYGKPYPSVRPTQPSSSNASRNSSAGDKNEGTNHSNRTEHKTSVPNATDSTLTSTKSEPSSVSLETSPEIVSVASSGISESSTIAPTEMSTMDEKRSVATEESLTSSTGSTTASDIQTDSYEVLSTAGNNPSRATERASSSFEESSITSEVPGTLPEYSTIVSLAVDSTSALASDITTSQVDQPRSASEVPKITSKNPTVASDLSDSTDMSSSTTSNLEKAPISSESTPTTIDSKIDSKSSFASAPPAQSVSTDVTEHSESTASTTDLSTKADEWTTAGGTTERYVEPETSTVHRKNQPRTTTRPPANTRRSRKRNRGNRKGKGRGQDLVSTNVVTKGNSTEIHQVLPVHRPKGKRKKNSNRGKGKKPRLGKEDEKREKGEVAPFTERPSERD